MTDLTDFLGPAADDLTAEQLADLERVAGRVHTIYDPETLDDAMPEQEALSGAVLLACGDDTLEALAGELLAARLAVERARQRLAGAMLWEHLAGGVSDYRLAGRTGLARGTVRKAMGL